MSAPVTVGDRRLRHGQPAQRSRRRSSASARASRSPPTTTRCAPPTGSSCPASARSRRRWRGCARRGLDELIVARARAGTPVLGLCLGMQLLFERLRRARRRRAGSGCSPARVSRAGPARGPQAPAHRLERGALRAARRRSTEGLPRRRRPSTTCTPSPPSPPTPADVLGRGDYGGPFVSIVARDNVFGAQFHPEKSSTARAARCCATSPRSARGSACDPLPGDRHPRRPGRAAAPGRLRREDRLPRLAAGGRARVGRGGRALPARRRPRRRAHRQRRRTCDHLEAITARAARAGAVRRRPALAARGARRAARRAPSG